MATFLFFNELDECCEIKPNRNFYTAGAICDLLERRQNVFIGICANWYETER